MAVAVDTDVVGDVDPAELTRWQKVSTDNLGYYQGFVVGNVDVGFTATRAIIRCRFPLTDNLTQCPD